MKRSSLVALVAFWPSFACAQWAFEDFLDITVHPETAIANVEADNLKGNVLKITCATKWKEPMDLIMIVDKTIYDAYPNNGTPDFVLHFDNRTVTLKTKKTTTEVISVADMGSSFLLTLVKEMRMMRGPMTLTYGAYRFTFPTAGIDTALNAIVKTCDRPVS